jgi:hypothetical protein
MGRQARPGTAPSKSNISEIISKHAMLPPRGHTYTFDCDGNLQTDTKSMALPLLIWRRKAERDKKPTKFPLALCEIHIAKEPTRTISEAVVKLD